MTEELQVGDKVQWLMAGHIVQGTIAEIHQERGCVPVAIVRMGNIRYAIETNDKSLFKVEKFKTWTWTLRLGEQL